MKGDSLESGLSLESPPPFFFFFFLQTHHRLVGGREDLDELVAVKEWSC